MFLVSSVTSHPTPLTTTPFLAAPTKLPPKTAMSRDGPDILEYPFLTLRSFPEGFIQRLGMMYLHCSMYRAPCLYFVSYGTAGVILKIWLFSTVILVKLILFPLQCNVHQRVLRNYEAILAPVVSKS